MNEDDERIKNLIIYNAWATDKEMVDGTMGLIIVVSVALVVVVLGFFYFI